MKPSHSSFNVALVLRHSRSTVHGPQSTVRSSLQWTIDHGRWTISLFAFFIFHFLLAPSSLAGETLVLNLKKNNSAVVILDRFSTDGQRPAVVIPDSTRPGQVDVEHPNANPKGWTEVRWVIRFDLSKVTAPIQQARLHLWCQLASGSPKAPPMIDVVEPADPDKILAADRTSEPLLPKGKEFEFPAQADMVEVDVTPLVQEALKRKLPLAAFRISAVATEPDADDQPETYYFGGFENVYSWKHSEPPVLEITMQ
ncbi:MAG: hypothetical protein HY360_17010 [Verrucomicrobia bacterium]|nr:hypothetical protein [Verrucomicrobiota bacterium]